MRAGNLNRLITIQSKTVTKDTFGQDIETWGDNFQIWASVTTTGGGEFYAAQKLNSEISILFKVRYTSSITVLDRIIYDNKTYGILYLNNIDGMRKELQIACKGVE